MVGRNPGRRFACPGLYAGARSGRPLYLYLGDVYASPVVHHYLYLAK